MNKKHCDICEKIIENHETYYSFKQHWWNGFQQHNFSNMDVCLNCMLKIKKMVNKDIQDEER